MSAWVKAVEAIQIEDGRRYFVARGRREYAPGMFTEWRFQGTNARGRTLFITKPGMATVFIGSEGLRTKMAEMKTLVAVEVPANAHKRWRARDRRLI